MEKDLATPKRHLNISGKSPLECNPIKANWSDGHIIIYNMLFFRLTEPFFPTSSTIKPFKEMYSCILRNMSSGFFSMSNMPKHTNVIIPPTTFQKSFSGIKYFPVLCGWPNLYSGTVFKIFISRRYFVKKRSSSQIVVGEKAPGNHVTEKRKTGLVPVVKRIFLSKGSNRMDFQIHVSQVFRMLMQNMLNTHIQP